VSMILFTELERVAERYHANITITNPTLEFEEKILYNQQKAEVNEYDCDWVEFGMYVDVDM
jgi:hypothetical protein